MNGARAPWEDWYAAVVLAVCAAFASLIAGRPAAQEFAAVPPFPTARVGTPVDPRLFVMPPFVARRNPAVRPPADLPAVLMPPVVEPPKAAVRPAPVVDSAMGREEALGRNSFPLAVLAKMAVVDVEYLGMDGRDHRGQIVVHRDLADEVEEIFRELKRARFPVDKVVPIVRYGWDDDQSMADDNTSGFNYRGVITARGESTRLSLHATGRAIDLNPDLNPYRGSKVWAPYDPSVPGTLTRQSAAVRVFLSRGWQWGGNWSVKDYQHFEKP